MSSLNDQVNARKRRLEELKKHSEQAKKAEPLEKVNNPQISNGDAHGSGKLKYTGPTVELLSAEIEKEALNEFKRTADSIITDFAKKQEQISKTSGTRKTDNVHKSSATFSLDDKLAELDRRTDDQIKRLVRKKLMKEATSVDR